MKKYFLITLLVFIIIILIVLKLKCDTKSKPKENFYTEDPENDDSKFSDTNNDEISFFEENIHEECEQSPFNSQSTNTSFYSARNDFLISNYSSENDLNDDGDCTTENNLNDDSDCTVESYVSIDSPTLNSNRTGESRFANKGSDSTNKKNNSYTDFIYAPLAYEKYLSEINEIQENPSPKTFDDFVLSCIPSFLRNIESFFSSLKLKIDFTDLKVLNFRVLLYFRKRLANEIEIVCKNLKRSRRYRKLVVWLHLIIREYCKSLLSQKLEDKIIKLDRYLVKIKIDDEFRKRIELIINMCYRMLQINKISDNEHFKLIGLSFYIITEQICKHPPNLFTENTWNCTLDTFLDGVTTVGNNFNPFRRNKTPKIYEDYYQSTLWRQYNEDSNSENISLDDITPEDLRKDCFCKKETCICGGVMINETILNCKALDNLESDVMGDLKTEYGRSVFRFLNCLEAYANTLKIIRKKISSLSKIGNNKQVEVDGCLNEKEYLRKSLQKILEETQFFDSLMENAFLVFHSLEPEYDRMAYGLMKNTIFNINKLLPEMLKKVLNHVS